MLTSAPVTEAPARTPSHRRTRRVLTVAAASYAGRIASFVAVLGTIPLVRGQLSPELFGVWMMLSGLMAFFAFADFGVGNAVMNRVTRAHAVGDLHEVVAVTRAGYLCTATFGAAILAIWGLWYQFAADPVVIAGPIAPENRAEVLSALQLFVLLLALAVPSGMVQRLQLGMQCGQRVGVVQAVVAGGIVAAVLVVRGVDGGLSAYVAATLGVQVTGNLLNAWLWHGRLRRQVARAAVAVAPQRRLLDDIVSLLRTGSQFLVLQLAAAFAFQSDAIVVVQQLGQGAYGNFAIVQRVFIAASSLLLAGLAGLWPAIGEATAAGDRDWVRRAVARSYLSVGLCAGAMAVLLALGMPALLQLWLGRPFNPPATLLLVLAIWTAVEALGNVSGTVMNAAGQLRQQALAALSMGALAFAGKWMLVPALGAWGAVLATLIAYLLISVPVQVAIVGRILRGPASV